MLSHFFRLTLILVLPSYLAACSTSQAISPQKSEVLAQGNKVPKATIQATKPKQLTARDVEIAEQKSYEVAIKQLQTIPKDNPPRTQQDVEILLRHRGQVITMLQSCTDWARQENTRNPKALTQQDDFLITYFNLYPEHLKRVHLITYFNLYPDLLKHTLIHKVSEGKRLVSFPCSSGGGGYQSPSVLFLYLETSSKPFLQPLDLIYPDRDPSTGQFVKRHPFKSKIFDGRVMFDQEDPQRFNIWFRGRGFGACGILWFYKVVDREFVLEKVKAHPKCDGEAPPSKYLQIYP